MKYGIYFAYWEKEWNVDQKKYISKVKDLGFDILEISCAMLKNISKDELLEMKKIAEGKSITLPEDVHKKIDDRTDPTWPTTWFVPRTTGEGAFRDVYSVMANWGANHGAFIHGHVGADLITLASMLRIPVVMHNVEEEKIFRPHAWGSFGTRDSEAADMAACKAYGPLYG